MNPATLDLNGYTTHPPFATIPSAPRCTGLVLVISACIGIIFMGFLNLGLHNYITPDKLLGKILVPVGSIGLISSCIVTYLVYRKMQDGKEEMLEYGKGVMEHPHDWHVEEDAALPSSWYRMRRNADGEPPLYGLVVPFEGSHRPHIFNSLEDMKKWQKDFMDD